MGWAAFKNENKFLVKFYCYLSIAAVGPQCTVFLFLKIFIITSLYIEIKSQGNL